MNLTNKKEDHIAKVTSSRFSKPFFIEDLEKLGCLNIEGLKSIAIKRCQIAFQYDGNAFVYEYRCEGSQKKTQHTYIPTENRFVCAKGQCGEKDFIRKLSKDKDLADAYDYLVEAEKAKEAEEIYSIADDILNEKAKTKVTLEQAAANLIREEVKITTSEEEEIEEQAKDTEDVVPRNEYDRDLVIGLKRMDMIDEKDNTFLIDNLIPNGELTVLAGSGGESKSYVSLAIAAAVSRGYGFPYTKDDETKVEPKDVLIYTKEDSLEKILAARLRILEARKDKIWATEEIIDMSSDKGLQRLENDIEDIKPALVIVDPGTAYCGNLDLERRQQALKFLYPLADIAKRKNIPIVLIFHFNKDYTAESVVSRIAGSAAIIDAARSALIVIKNPDNLEQKLIVHVKGNYSEEGKSLVYEVKKDELEIEGKKGPGQFHWFGYSKIVARDLSGNRDKELEDFITNTLSDGEMLSTQLNEQIKEAIEGVNDTQIHKAKGRLGITFKTGGAFKKRETGKLWWNRLPKHLQKLK